MNGNKHLGEGAKINYTTTGAVTQGSVIQFTNICGVALVSATGAGETVPCAITGEYQLTKAAAADSGFTQGDLVYITSTGAINNTATGDKVIGHASAAAATGATTVNVILSS